MEATDDYPRTPSADVGLRLESDDAMDLAHGNKLKRSLWRLGCLSCVWIFDVPRGK